MLQSLRARWLLQKCAGSLWPEIVGPDFAHVLWQVVGGPLGAILVSSGLQKIVFRDLFVRFLGFRDFVETAFSLQFQLDSAVSGGSPDHIFSRCFQAWFLGALLRRLLDDFYGFWVILGLPLEANWRVLEHRNGKRAVLLAQQAARRILGWILG